MPRYVPKGPRGQSKAFSRQQIAQIAGVVAGHPRNAALWSTAVSTCLRSADLLALRVRQVTDSSGAVRERFTANVQKVTNFHSASVRRSTVTCLLSPQAQHLIQSHIAHAGLGADAKLFDLTTSRYRQLVKAWVAAVGLDPKQYSGHSTRRTLPSIIYGETKDLATCRQLLGHKDLTHTAAYLSVDTDKAIFVARNVMGY